MALIKRYSILSFRFKLIHGKHFFPASQFTPSVVASLPAEVLPDAFAVVTKRTVECVDITHKHANAVNHMNA